jgi:hypothetical protein
MERLQCPFCDYRGSCGQIEAHISGKTDEAHSGKLGSDWRNTIRDSVDEESSGDSEPVESEESQDDPDSVGQDEGVHSFRYVLAASAALVLGSLVASSEGQGDQEEEDSEDEQTRQDSQQGPNLPGV